MGIESLSSITKQVRGCKVDQEEVVVEILSINSDLINENNEVCQKNIRKP